MQWCHVNFSPENPCCHGNQPFLFKDKIGFRLTRASYAETQLLGYIAWQWDRYLVPQNVFLVLSENDNKIVIVHNDKVCASVIMPVLRLKFFRQVVANKITVLQNLMQMYRPNVVNFRNCIKTAEAFFLYKRFFERIDAAPCLLLFLLMSHYCSSFKSSR